MSGNSGYPYEMKGRILQNATLFYGLSLHPGNFNLQALAALYDLIVTDYGNEFVYWYASKLTFSIRKMIFFISNVKIHELMTKQS